MITEFKNKIINGDSLQELKKIPSETFDLILTMIKNVNQATPELQKLFADFKQSTSDELWDSEEQIETFFQNPVEYQKLLDGNIGQNLLFFYRALCISETMYDFTKFIMSMSAELIKQKNISYKKEEFLSISNYCLGACHDIFSEDRMNNNPEFLFDYDIPRWLNSENLPLNSFKFDNPQKIIFKYSPERQKVIQDNLKIYGNNKIGRSQVVKVTRDKSLYRDAHFV